MCVCSFQIQFGKQQENLGFSPSTRRQTGAAPESWSQLPIEPPQKLWGAWQGLGAQSLPPAWSWYTQCPERGQRTQEGCRGLVAPGTTLTVTPRSPCTSPHEGHVQGTLELGVSEKGQYWLSLPQRMQAQTRLLHPPTRDLPQKSTIMCLLPVHSGTSPVHLHLCSSFSGYTCKCTPGAVKRLLAFRQKSRGHCHDPTATDQQLQDASHHLSITNPHSIFPFRLRCLLQHSQCV